MSEPTPSPSEIPSLAPFAAHTARVFITFLDPFTALARVELSLARARPESHDPLVLEGFGLAEATEGVWLNGQPLDWRALLSQDQRQLVIPEAPAEAFFCCQTRLALRPPGSAQGGLWSHQGRAGAECDPLGFHAIAWAPRAFFRDPEWACEIEARAEEFPSLEANGILVDFQLLNGRQRLCYHDPEPKPARLFKLRAGPL